MLEEYYKIKNYRCVEVRFLGPTNHRDARVKLSVTDHRGKQSVILSYDYTIGEIGEQAYKWLSARGWNIVAKCCLPDRDLLICDNWAENYIDLKE